MAGPAQRRMTLADLAAAEAEGRRVELVGGELVEKEASGDEHARAHGAVPRVLGGHFWGRGGPGGPGGWVFLVEPTIALPDHETAAPDVAGWRIERAPERGRWPVAPRPDWVCEVSQSSLRRDIVWKLARYRAAGIPHYWVLDVGAMVFTVYRLTPDGYLVALSAEVTETVRAEPFDAVELRVWELFGLLDPPE